MLITSVEEHYIVSVLFDQLMDLLWLEVLTTTDDTVLVDFEFIVAILEPDEFAAVLHAHTREIFTRSIAPLEYDILETRQLFSLFDVLLQVSHFTAHGAVESMARDQYATTQVETIAKRFLPELHRLRVCEWREFIVE